MSDEGVLSALYCVLKDFLSTLLCAEGVYEHLSNICSFVLKNFLSPCFCTADGFLSTLLCADRFSVPCCVLKGF